VGIIDRNGNGENHGVNRDVVVREAGQAGYKLIEQYDFVKSDGEDYFLVFEIHHSSDGNGVSSRDLKGGKLHGKRTSN
jgi:hypothetical protein